MENRKTRKQVMDVSKALRQAYVLLLCHSLTVKPFSGTYPQMRGSCLAPVDS